MAKKTNEQSNRLTAQNFSNRYGRDEGKLASWQMLCRDIEVPAGNSVTQCKKNLKGVYLNIVDFVSAMTTGGQLHKFSSVRELRSYITNTGKIFRLKIAKQNPLLKQLLINVF